MNQDCENNDDPLKLELEGEDKERYLEIVNTRKAVLREYREQYERYVDSLYSILLRHKNKYYDEDVIDTKGAILDAVFAGVPPEVFCRVTDMDYEYVYKLYKINCLKYGLDIPQLNNKDLSRTVLHRIRNNNELTI